MITWRPAPPPFRPVLPRTETDGTLVNVLFSISDPSISTAITFPLLLVITLTSVGVVPPPKTVATGGEFNSAKGLHASSCASACPGIPLTVSKAFFAVPTRPSAAPAIESTAPVTAPVTESTAPVTESTAPVTESRTFLPASINPPIGSGRLPPPPRAPPIIPRKSPGASGALPESISP